VTFVNHAPTQAPVTSLELELDVPAFLEYVGKGKGTSAAFGDCAPYKVTSRNTTRDGKPYKRYRISAPPIHRGKAVFEQGLLKRFQVGDQLSPVWPTRAKSTCAILFTLPKSARGVAPGQQFHIYHRRIINGNKTDFIESFPMEIMPPLTGRCPKRFKLWNHPTPWSYSGASPSEAPNVCDLLLKRNTAMGVRILHAPVGAESYLRATYRRMHKAGYTMEVGWCNGMNYLMTPEGAGRDKWTGTGLRFLYEHPEYQARWYTGNKERLLAATAGMSPRIHDPDIPPEKQPFMWCQQYVAEGGKHYLDRWRAQLKREYADVIPGPKVLVWDWEYATMKNSCFCRRCIAAFKKYARLRASAEITPEIMAADHTLKWIDFRMQQSADHIRSFRKMANKLGIELCVYTSGGDLDEPRGGLKWEIIGDAPNWAWLGWPGNTGKGGIHLRNTERTFDNLTEYVGPNVRLVGQVMYLTYWPSGGSDPRQRKIDLVKAACYTRSAMSVWSRTGYGGLTDQAGTSYWTAQAMDFIARYEDFLLDGTRSRVSVQVEGIDAETNLTAFDHKGERLVLLFNETRKPLEVAVTVRNVPAGKRPHFNDSRTPLKDDGPHRLTLPLMNVSVLHYR
jgi:hypothetical protein